MKEIKDYQYTCGGYQLPKETKELLEKAKADMKKKKAQTEKKTK